METIDLLHMNKKIDEVHVYSSYCLEVTLVKYIFCMFSILLVLVISHMLPMTILVEFHYLNHLREDINKVRYFQIVFVLNVKPIAPN